MENTDDDALTPLHPSHVTVLRIVTGLATLPFVIVALVLEVRAFLFPGAFMVPVVLGALFIVLRVPLRRYAARGREPLRGDSPERLPAYTRVHSYDQL